MAVEQGLKGLVVACTAISIISSKETSTGRLSILHGPGFLCTALHVLYRTLNCLRSLHFNRVVHVILALCLCHEMMRGWGEGNRVVVAEPRRVGGASYELKLDA